METLSPAFAALVSIVERLTQRKWSASQWATWTAPHGEIRTPVNDVEGLLHELCHWIVADEKVRDQANYGIEDDFSISGRSSDDKNDKRNFAAGSKMPCMLKQV